MGRTGATEALLVAICFKGITGAVTTGVGATDLGFKGATKTSKGSPLLAGLLVCCTGALPCRRGCSCATIIGFGGGLLTTISYGSSSTTGARVDDAGGTGAGAGT